MHQAGALRGGWVACLAATAPMLLRSATFLLLVALAAGCDSVDPKPDMFEATFRGDVQKAITGDYAYTLLSRYTGLGTGDGYAIQLRTRPSPSDSYQLYWTTSDSTDVVDFGFSDGATPEGVYQIEGQPWCGAAFALNGQFYVVQAGTVTVNQRRGRLIGTFEFTGTYRSAEDGGPSNIQVSGRFDIAQDD